MSYKYGNRNSFIRSNIGHNAKCVPSIVSALYVYYKYPLHRTLLFHVLLLLKYNP